MPFKKISKNTRFNLGTSIGNNPMTFPLFYWSKSRKNGIIRKDSDICIEGFQRSGNTFFHFCFKRWNREAKIAHHLHASGQVIKALEYKIPTIVLIRPPLDSIASLLIKDLDLKVGNALNKYHQFYSNLLPYKSQMLIAPFEEVIEQPGNLVTKINERFGSDFNYEILTDNQKNNYQIQIQKANARKAVTSTWERSSVPSLQKEQAKNSIKGSIEKNKYLSKSQLIYKQFID